MSIVTCCLAPSSTSASKSATTVRHTSVKPHRLHESLLGPKQGCCSNRRASEARHYAHIAGSETQKLKGQIFDLERKARLKPLIRPSSGVAPRMGDSLDVLGHIPWHPAGKGRCTMPLCKAGPELSTVSSSSHFASHCSRCTMQAVAWSDHPNDFCVSPSAALEAALTTRVRALSHWAPLGNAESLQACERPACTA